MAKKVNFKTKKTNSSFLKKVRLNAGLLSLLIILPVISIIVDVNNHSLYQEPHAAEVQPVGQTSGWHMIFSDEFNNTALNTALWTPGWFGTGISGPINTSETACYDGSYATEPGDGYLHLPLKNVQNTCRGTVHQYTGSMINSDPNDGVVGHTGFRYTYGYVEFHVYLPPKSTGVIANWPGTWSGGGNQTDPSTGQQVGWPTTGENDTMEGLGTAGQACYHFHSPSGGPGGCATSDYTGWHTFASDWEPGVVTYYYDGKVVGQITLGITSYSQSLKIDNTTSTTNILVPDDMLVDYVRVWQKCTSTTCPTATPTGAVPTNTPVPTTVVLSPTPTVGIADSQAPSVTSLAITNSQTGALVTTNTVARKASYTITANAQDNIGVSKVVITVSGTTCTDTTAPYTCTWTVPGKPGATYTVKATAYDGAGNVSAPYSMTVTSQ